MTIRSANGRSASALLCVLLMMVLIGIVMGYYLTYVINEHRLSGRSQIWNSCIPIAEAGIEEALAHINRNGATNLPAEGWALLNGECRRTRTIGDNSVSVCITTNNPHRVLAAGCVPYDGIILCRTVRVDVSRIELSIGGLTTLNRLRMNGNPTLINSYDSTDPLKSTNGRYDAAKARDEAVVTCVSGPLDLGNGDVWGKIVTGVGVKVSGGPNSVVGSSDWHLARSGGTEPGALQTDPSLFFPDVEAPYESGTELAPGTVDGVTYDAVLSDDEYITDQLNGKLLVQGHATVYVTGNVNVAGGGFIQLAPGASLAIYVKGARAAIQEVRMTPASGSHLTVLGMPTLRNVDIYTDPGAPCLIYAPQASFNMSGGDQFYGALVCGDFSNSGNPQFHFDLSMGKVNTEPQLKILSWTEL